MYTVKDRKGKELTEAQDINKWWQEYTEEWYKSNNNNHVDNQNGVITHLKPDILEYEVKWVLGNITMNKVRAENGIPAELYQLLKDDAVKVWPSIFQ